MYFEILSTQINMTHIQSFKYFLIYEMSLLNGYPLNRSKLTSNIFEIDQCSDLDLAIYKFNFIHISRVRSEKWVSSNSFSV